MKTLLNLLIFLITCNSFSQNCGIVSYSYKMPSESLQIKHAELYFNDTISKFVYSKTSFEKEDTENRYEMKNGAMHMQFKSHDEEGSGVYRDFANNIIIERDCKTGLSESIKYQDDWIPIDWEITDESKKIGRFICKKAIGDFRGRTYIAWFTEEIPVPYGPWKLYGLPGLILQAEDSKYLFKAVVKLIKYPTECSSCDLKFPTATTTKTLKDYVYFLDHFTEIFCEKFNAKLPRGMRVEASDGNSQKERKYRLEKIYEWEK